MLEQTKKCDGCGRVLDGEGLPIPMFPVQHCCSLECITAAIAKADPSFPATAAAAAQLATAKAQAKADAIASTAAMKARADTAHAAAIKMFADKAQAEIDAAKAKTTVGQVTVAAQTDAALK